MSCFRKIPNSVIEQFNVELCNELFEVILKKQEKKLSLNCTAGKLEQFTGKGNMDGIKESLKDKLYQLK